MVYFTKIQLRAARVARDTSTLEFAVRLPKRRRPRRLPQPPRVGARAARLSDEPYFVSAAVTSARTWRSAFGTRWAVFEATFESFDGLASYSS